MKTGLQHTTVHTIKFMPHKCMVMQTRLGYVDHEGVYTCGCWLSHTYNFIYCALPDTVMLYSL